MSQSVLVLMMSSDRWQKRMIKNRESAARSRARKQAYTNELENKVSRLEEENERLRKQKVAVALEKAAQSDEYFVKRKLYPNVDFYTGFIYRAMGFPTVFFPVLFAIPRVLPSSGHAISQLFDLSVIQVHIEEWLRHYMPLKEQIASTHADKLSQVSVSNATKCHLLRARSVMSLSEIPLKRNF